MIGELMFVYRKLFENRSEDVIKKLDFGRFGSAILNQLNFALFGELTTTTRASLLWTDFVSRYGQKLEADQG